LGNSPLFAISLSRGLFWNWLRLFDERLGLFWGRLRETIRLFWNRLRLFDERLGLF
jgi:hypothetical protein